MEGQDSAGRGGDMKLPGPEAFAEMARLKEDRWRAFLGAQREDYERFERARNELIQQFQVALTETADAHRLSAVAHVERGIARVSEEVRMWAVWRERFEQMDMGPIVIPVYEVERGTAMRREFLCCGWAVYAGQRCPECGAQVPL